MRCGSIALVALALACHGRVSLPSPDASADAAPPADAAIFPTSDAGLPPDTAPVVIPANVIWDPCGAMGAAVTALAHSPNGALLAAGHADGRVSIFNLAGGPTMALVPAGAPVERLAFAPDGRRLAVLGGGVVREVALDGSTIRTLGAGPGAGRSLQYSGGATPLLLATTEPMGAPNVRVWNLTDPVPVRGFAGTALATFADGGEALLQIDETAHRVFTVPIAGGSSRSFVLASEHLTPSPDGGLVAGWADRPGGGVHLSLFSTTDGTTRWDAKADLPRIEQLVFLPAVKRLMVVTDDLGMLFDLATGSALGSFPRDLFGRPERGFVVEPSPDGRSLALVKARDGRLRLLSTDDGRPLGPPLDFGVTDEIFTFAAARTGRLLATSGGHGHTWILDPFDGQLRHVVSAEAAFKPDFSPDGTLFALAGDARAIFRMSDGMQISGVAPPATVSLEYSWPGLVFSADGRTLASGNDGKVELYDLGGMLLSTRPSGARAPGVAFSPDGKWMATSGPELYATDGDRRVWPRDLVFAPATNDQRLPDDSVAFSPDGKLLLVSNAFLLNGKWTATTKLLKVEDGSVVRDFGASLGRRPSFSPDGSWVLGGKALVHLATGRQLTLPEPEISASTFLRDGSIAAATPSDRLVRLFCPRGFP